MGLRWENCQWLGNIIFALRQKAAVRTLQLGMPLSQNKVLAMLRHRTQGTGPRSQNILDVLLLSQNFQKYVG